MVDIAGGYTVPRGQDVMISVYNIHHSPAVWEDAEAFQPERFSLDKPPPTEQNTDFRFAFPDAPTSHTARLNTLGCRVQGYAGWRSGRPALIMLTITVKTVACIAC